MRKILITGYICSEIECKSTKGGVEYLEFSVSAGDNNTDGIRDVFVVNYILKSDDLLKNIVKKGINVSFDGTPFGGTCRNYSGELVGEVCIKTNSLEVLPFLDSNKLTLPDEKEQEIHALKKKIKELEEAVNDFRGVTNLLDKENVLLKVEKELLTKQNTEILNEFFRIKSELYTERLKPNTSSLGVK